ncbi:unnamed protein product [Victoria cruziana]
MIFLWWPFSSICVITRASLVRAQGEEIQKVMDLLTVKEQHARTLLIYHRWDVEKMLAMLEEIGKDALFNEAGVSVSNPKNKNSLCSKTSIACEICIEEVPLTNATSMDCGHCFCNDCWTEHFVVRISEGQSRRIRCMAHKCNTICDEAVVRNLLIAKDPAVAVRFESYLLESYIEDNSKVKWCPSIPHCGNAIFVEEGSCREVQCTCGLQFCFSCLSEAHSPCSCMMWDLWLKKLRSESENFDWITVHTKSCPKCHKVVEKDGGCNLVTCICGQSFCWLCGAATGFRHTWLDIEGHSCGSYKASLEKKGESTRQYPGRFWHYYSRYKAHMDSLNLETKLKESEQNNILTSENKVLGVNDYYWLRNGFDRLLRSRHILSRSYAFAFCMFVELYKVELSEEEIDMKKNLFEEQQQQLESMVERLSELIAKPFDGLPSENVREIRMHIINLSAIVDNLCRKMYECIQNDLFGSLLSSVQTIAPYYSEGVEKASEIDISRRSYQTQFRQESLNQKLVCLKSNDKAKSIHIN